MKEKDKNLCMEILIHAADVSNPAKPFNLYSQWAERVLEEFWNQGDQEKSMGLPVSYLCDRFTVNVATSQIGFIDVIVMPLYEAVRAFLPQTEPMLVNMRENKVVWKDKVPLYDQKLSKILLLLLLLFYS
jgi:hypothetical protein